MHEQNTSLTNQGDANNFASAQQLVIGGAPAQTVDDVLKQQMQKKITACTGILKSESMRLLMAQERSQINIKKCD